MLPKHLKKVPEDRKAIAPYNFVELPEKVVEAEPLPDNDRYYKDRHTGQITCTLITESPIYTRCGLTKDEFKQGKETKDLPDFFYTELDSKVRKPVIPGSSLRGMLRTIVEIVSFSKIERVSDQQLIYRAVGDTTSLGRKYRERLLRQENRNTYSFLMQAGYIIQQGSNWAIQPAKPVIQEESFARIEQRDIRNIPVRLERWNEIKNAYKIAVRFEQLQLYHHNQNRVRLCYAKATPIPGSNHRGSEYNSVLVKTGSAPRKHLQFIFGLPDNNADLINIPDEMIQEYKEQLTDGQKQILGDKGALHPMQPVFYIAEDNNLVFFGHAMMFRLPYKDSISNFVPLALRQPNIKLMTTYFKLLLVNYSTNLKYALLIYMTPLTPVDITEAIFGFVRDKKQEDNQARAGRVFISDAICEKAASEDIWFTGSLERTITPQILSTPKPTTFQHYLVQTDPEARKRELKHYANKPEAETVIRGHKLYWHKGRSPSVVLNDPEASESQTTQIKPIKAGVSFTFTIDFENLSDVELGAILWVLNIAQKEEYRLSIGMGKPLGMGAIKITYQIHLSDRKQRYKKLFQDNNWHIGEKSDAADTHHRCVKAFEKYVLNHISEADQPNTGKATTLEELPRIKMLLAMLSWSGVSSNEARYMEIERDHQPRIGTDKNEYKERPVLPTPLQVIGWEDNRKINKPNPSPQPKAKGSKPVLKKSKSPTRLKKEGGREDKGSGNPAFARPPKPPKRR